MDNRKFMVPTVTTSTFYVPLHDYAWSEKRGDFLYVPCKRSDMDQMGFQTYVWDHKKQKWCDGEFFAVETEARAWCRKRHKEFCDEHGFAY